MVTYKVSLTLLFETKEEKIFTDGKGSLVTVKQTRRGGELHSFWDRVSVGRPEDPIEVVFVDEKN